MLFKFKSDNNVLQLLKMNNVSILGNGENIGLSKAYNHLFKNLKKNNYQYSFLIDQDSIFDNYIVKDFLIML